MDKIRLIVSDMDGTLLNVMISAYVKRCCFSIHFLLESYNSNPLSVTYPLNGY